MSKLSFDLINLILSFRPAHPVSQLIKNKKEELIDSTFTKKRIVVKKNTPYKFIVKEEDKERYETYKENFNFYKSYFCFIFTSRFNKLCFYENQLCCCFTDEKVKMMSLKVNNYMKKFINTTYYYNSKGKKRFYNETKLQRYYREKEEKLEEFSDDDEIHNIEVEMIQNNHNITDSDEE
jgi:hypothetical protein